MRRARIKPAPLTNADLFLLRILDRGGSLEGAKNLFAKAVVRASIRRAGSYTEAADQLNVHRNTISRHLSYQESSPK